jgi:hypothetical protein
MTIYDEVIVRAVLVLTYTGFDKGRSFHCWKPETKIIAKGGEFIAGYDAIV